MGFPLRAKSRIKGQIKNFHPTYLTLYLPHKGADTDLKPYRLSVDEEGRFNASLSLLSSGFVSFYHYGAAAEIRFWVSPGSEDEIIFDWADPLSSFAFSGTHQAINGYLNSGKLLRTAYYEEEIWVKGLLKRAKTSKGLMAGVALLKQEEKGRLEALNASCRY